MKEEIILDLCGGTGSWSKPFKDRGFDVRVLTLPDFDVEKWKEDKEFVDLLHSNKVVGILAAPPCTMFSIARNDKTAKKPRDTRKGMKTVNACLEIIWECLYKPYKISENSLKFWAMENPNGYLKRFLGNPVLDFQPHYYGDPYSKRTLIWGMFELPTRNDVKKRDFEHPTTKGAKDYVSCVEHFADLKQIPEGYMEKTGINKRDTLRSMTPKGFAEQFCKAQLKNIRMRGKR